MPNTCYVRLWVFKTDFIMYINLSELTHLKVIVDKMQDIIETQTAQKNGNELFPETSLFEMREFCNKAEEIIKTVEDREVRSRAKNIVRKRQRSNLT